MESKILNFPDAMKLAQVLSKYLEPDKIKTFSELEMIELLLSKIIPEDYAKIILAITNLSLIEFSKLSQVDKIATLIKEFRENKIYTLIGTYKEIGF